jgi:apolipoprotein N-acyltransferase
MASPSERGGGLVLAASAAALSAVAFYIGTGLHPQWWAAWLAPVPPLLYAYRSKAVAACLVAFTAYAAGSTNLLLYFRVLELPIAIRILALTGPSVVFALGILLSRTLFLRRQYFLAIVALPTVWVSFEYLNSLGANGTALNLAYSQMNFLPILQLASVTGIWGISFAIFFFASALAVIVAAPNTNRRFIAAGSIAILSAVFAFGFARLQASPDSARVVIGLAATDHRPLLASREEDASAIVSWYSSEIERLAEKGAKVVVVPEKIGPITDALDGPTLSAFSEAARRNAVMVVVGVDRKDEPLKHNLAFVFGPDGSLQTSYEKHFMVPRWEDGYERGARIGVLAEPHQGWAVAICKDMDFPSFTREYARSGVQLMLVPAWDFTVDDWLHSRMAVLRGVEGGFAIARSAKQGQMTISDNRGRILAEEHSSHSGASIIGSLSPGSEETIYARLGDWFAWVNLAILISLIATLFRCRDSLKNQGPQAG